MSETFATRAPEGCYYPFASNTSPADAAKLLVEKAQGLRVLLELVESESRMLRNTANAYAMPWPQDFSLAMVYLTFSSEHARAALNRILR